jgi:hypothetical protein
VGPRLREGADTPAQGRQLRQLIDAADALGAQLEPVTETPQNVVQLAEHRRRASSSKFSEIGGAVGRGQAVRRRLQASQQAGWGTHAEAWSHEDAPFRLMKPP